MPQEDKRDKVIQQYFGDTKWSVEAREAIQYLITEAQLELIGKDEPLSADKDSTGHFEQIIRNKFRAALRTKLDKRKV